MAHSTFRTIAGLWPLSCLFFSCTCPFQYAYDARSHWCLHPENDPNLAYFCDWKICRLFPQSPRHTITITHSASLWLISGICHCHVTNRLNSDIHRFIVSEDGYLCTLSTSGKITLLRLAPFSKISKVVNLQNSSLHNCVSFVSSGCSRRVICLRQTSICFRSVFCWIC